MSKVPYINKKTNKKVTIVLKRDNLIKVKYTHTGTVAWYTQEDFYKLFSKVTE